MALTHIALVAATGRGPNGNPMPVVDSVPLLAVSAAPGAASAVVDITAIDEWSVWDVTTDASIYIAFAADPTASSTAKGYLMLAGSQRNFAAKKGHKPAIKLV